MLPKAPPYIRTSLLGNKLLKRNAYRQIFLSWAQAHRKNADYGWEQARTEQNLLFEPKWLREPAQSTTLREQACMKKQFLTITVVLGTEDIFVIVLPKLARGFRKQCLPKYAREQACTEDNSYLSQNGYGSQQALKASLGTSLTKIQLLTRTLVP